MEAGMALQCCASGARGLPPDTSLLASHWMVCPEGRGGSSAEAVREGPDSVGFLSAEHPAPGQHPSSWREIRMFPRKHSGVFFPNRVVTQLISLENQSSIRTECFVFK